MRRLIAIVVVLAGCAEQRLISQFDLAESHCNEGLNSFTWKGQTRQYILFKSDDVGQIYDWCGHMAANAGACIKPGMPPRIYVSEWCGTWLPHELNHLFGNPGVHRPVVGNYRK